MIYYNNYDITKICKNANYSYLQKVLSQVRDLQQKNNIIDLFNRHMLQIAKFCIDNFLETGILSQKFIRELHKIHFPPGYQKTKRTTSGDALVVIMIPGVYKTGHTNFDRVSPEKTKDEMQKLIDKYNNNLNKNIDFILEFALNFYKIHPFGDGNGRILSILLDIILVKNNFNPIYIKNIIDSDYLLYQKLIDKSIKYNNKSLFIDKIKSLI